jgi:methyl-accepting chemotaxis protein
MNFNAMNVGTRLAIGFGLLSTALVAISLIALLRLDTLHQQIGELVDNRMVKIALLTELKDNLNAIARVNRNVALIVDVKDATAEAQRIEPLQVRNSALLAELEKTITLPRAKELLAQMHDSRAAYNRLLAESLKLGLTSNTDDQAAATKLIMGPLRTQQNALFKAVDDSLALQQALARKAGEEATAAVSSGTRLVLGTAIGATLLGLILGRMIAVGVTRQLGAEPHALCAVVSRVADGDLSTELQVRAGDQASVIAAIARMQVALANVVNDVRHGSESVASASTQIAQGNLDLSGRTESQASALEQTSASMLELSGAVRQNADNARQANQLAQTASSVATEGGAVVSQVVDTMQEISASSKRIADIISVIDGIAFQTNILALNAAVEAARAGDQGRGFAVVASEVRNLAQRSATAAKEIKELIGHSVERVEQGAALVDQAGATMQQVVEAISRVTGFMGDISTASAEQSAAVAQVGTAVTQMDENTQQNAALVEEMAAAATALNGQAQELVQAVAVFRLKAGPARIAAAPVPRLALQAQ